MLVTVICIFIGMMSFPVNMCLMALDVPLCASVVWIAVSLIACIIGAVRLFKE